MYSWRAGRPSPVLVLAALLFWSQIQHVEKALAESARGIEALGAKVVKLEAEVEGVQGEHDAEREKMKGLEAKMREAAGGEKLKEREELKKVRGR